MEYKFNGARYMTRGIAAEIPFELQLIMWNMIDENIQRGLKMDYLQVFILSVKFENGVKVQVAEHRQEVPRRKNIIILRNPTFSLIKTKIFCIDDINHVTMLLAEEY